MAEIIKPPFFEHMVNAGEERLLTFLENKLPNNYYLIPNVEIASTNPRNNRTQYWEYDLLVVAPHAIYSIENKDWKGRLEGDDNYWYLNDCQRPNPLKLGRQKTAILHTKLNRKKSEWSNVWVQNMVTLSYYSQDKNGLEQEAVKLTFLLNDELISFLLDPYRVGKTKNEIAGMQKALVRYLSGEQSKKIPEQKREVQGYEIIEILDHEENYTEYLVKPKGVTSSIRKRVKEYALSIAGLNPEKLRIREEQIMNQYKALNKIKAKPFILNVEFKLDNENHLFYEITDFLNESSLRAEMKWKTFTNEEKLNIIYNLITALKEAHKENIYHRDINPDNVFMYTGYAYLGNFGKAYFTDHDEQGYTVMPTLTESTATPYHAIELLAKDASRASDIYSLGVLIYELFVGKVPVRSPFELNRLEGRLPEDRLPSSVNSNLPEWLDELCNKTILTDETERFDNLEELELFIKEATETQEEPLKKKRLVKSDTFDYQIGNTIGVYTIHKILGRGGYSQVFMVKHGLQGKVYAMKLFHESVSLSSVVDEYEALKDLKHSNIVKFIWNDRTPHGQFYTLMEYLDGENLKGYAHGDLSLPSTKIYQLGKEILSALLEMQRKSPPLLHRDIKPQNIIWDNKKRFVLIDFNVATALEANKDFVGTNPYLAPDLVMDSMKINWDTSADTFALGITLYELACKTYPWDNKMPIIGKTPIHPQKCNINISNDFSDFLLKAIGTKKDQRFKDAGEMLKTLDAIGEENILRKVEPNSKPGINIIDNKKEGQNIISYLNSLYSQSRFGNAGTRAKLNASALDRYTYIETKLDLHLLPAILDGNYKLVIITGNAGDGKTAFIRKIEEKVEKSSSLQHRNRNGATFKIKGTTYQSNYDGSQDEEERANNEVLEEFFKPFENVDDFSKACEGRIIAINEGRLAEFFQTSDKHKKLASIINAYFYEEGHFYLPDGVLIINLNLRSVVASTDKSESIFRKQVKKLTEPFLWEMCDNCKQAFSCFIRYNVRSFNDPSAGKEIVHRMEWLLRTISMKRELHITIRELRSFLAYMLIRDYRCKDIPDLISNAQNKPENYWQLFYFNITSPCDDNAANDRLIKLLWETDIAETASPSDDRDLYFIPHKQENYLAFENREYNLIDAFNNHKILIPTHEQTDYILKRIKQIHKIFIRHQYFEGKTNFKKRIPYKSVERFHTILFSSNGSEILKVIEKAKLNISRAISLNEGCENENVHKKYLVLSSSQVNDPNSKSYRLFPLSDFELFVNQTDHLVKYLEYEPDSLIFRHCNERHISLIISLDLYEMLDYIGKGYSPSLNDIRGRYIELQIFKNLLENLTYEEVIVTKDNLEFYKISKKEQTKLALEPLEID